MPGDRIRTRRVMMERTKALSKIFLCALMLLVMTPVFSFGQRIVVMRPRERSRFVVYQSRPYFVYRRPRYYGSYYNYPGYSSRYYSYRYTQPYFANPYTSSTRIPPIAITSMDIAPG